MSVVAQWGPASPCGMWPGAQAAKQGASPLLSILHLSGGGAATVEHAPLIALQHPSKVLPPIKKYLFFLLL